METPGEKAAREGLRESMRREGFHLRKGSTTMSAQKQNDTEGVVKAPVFFDFRVPMIYVLSAAAIVGSGLVGMYYKLDSVADNVAQLKTDVRANNAQTVQFAQEQALMKFRLEKLEQERGK